MSGDPRSEALRWADVAESMPPPDGAAAAAIAQAYATVYAGDQAGLNSELTSAESQFSSRLTTMITGLDALASSWEDSADRHAAGRPAEGVGADTLRACARQLREIIGHGGLS
jgi:hypothetical protein